MLAFWREGATEQVRDGFIKNKLAIQRSDCKLKRRKTFAVEADALARLPDIQRSFLSGAGYGSRTRLASLGSWSNTDIPTLQTIWTAKRTAPPKEQW